MRLLALLIISVAAAQAAPCAPIDGDKIRAKDLARVQPSFGQLDPEMVIALAPLPGTRRTITGRQLLALADSPGKPEAVPSSLCFERALSPLTIEQIRAAMRAELGAGTPRIEVLDFSRQAVPAGELRFPRSGLVPPAADHPVAAAFWRGVVRYSDRHTIAVWARVRILEKRPVLVAARDIRCGAVLEESDVALVVRDIFPLAPHIERKENAVGLKARRAIPAGLPITDAFVTMPPEIVAGDTVRVTATLGAARITLTALARSSGKKGDRVLLLNPNSHKTFRALVDGKGSARIVAGT